MDFNTTATSAITRKDIDFVCDHDTGKVWILHGKPFESQKDLQSVSFNQKTHLITLTGANGHQQTIPVAIHNPIAAQFALAHEVTLIYTHGGEILDMHVLPLSATN